MVSHFGSASGNQSADANSISHSHTISTGNSNIALICITAYREGSGDHMIDGSVVWDPPTLNESLTMLLDDFQTSNANIALSVLAGPSTGGPLNVTHTDDGKSLNNWIVAGANFSDVVQADPTKNEASTGSASGQPSHNTTTESDTDDEVVGGGYFHKRTSGSADETELYQGLTETDKFGGMSHTPSDADTSTNLSWTTSSSADRWIFGGMLVKHQAAAADDGNEQPYPIAAVPEFDAPDVVGY
jgi:hypothetical protein